jgi:hypothetical protein
MAFEIVTGIAKSIFWVLLLGWVLLRFFRYSEAKYPRPENCTRKDYKSWREMEALAVQLAVAGTICSVVLTILVHPKSTDGYIKFGAMQSVFWILGAITIPFIQSCAKNRARKLRILWTKMGTFGCD